MIGRRTFECQKCKFQWDVMRDSENLERVRLKCPSCQAKQGRRVFRPCNIVQDTFRKPIEMTTLNSVTGNPRGYDTIYTESERHVFLKKHDEMYGTKLQEW